MIALQQQIASLHLDQVLDRKEVDLDEFATKDCDTTATTSDCDDSLNENGSHSDGILRVATLEESPACVYVDRAANVNSTDQHAAAAAVEEEEEDHGGPFVEVSPKTVAFSSVEIREYPICLGDNPSVMKGVALSIAWEYRLEGQLSLDDYEASRPVRRQREAMFIPPFAREQILRNCGYSRSEIQKGVRDINIARQQRSRTSQTLHLQKAQEVAERLVRGTLNATIRRSKKKQERNLMEPFRAQAVGVSEEVGAVRRCSWHATSPALTLAPDGPVDERASV